MSVQSVIESSLKMFIQSFSVIVTTDIVTNSFLSTVEVQNGYFIL